MSKDLRVVSISDIHLGHHVTLSESIYENLKVYFYPELTSETDILFICGDFFDRLLNLDSKSSSIAITIIHELIQKAIKNNFIIRVLNGTFSHDKYQNQLFATIAEKYRNVDLKVINEISIEKIEDLECSILYLPDDLPYNDTEEVYKVIHTLLEDNNLEKVDFIIGHGTLEYALPEHVHKDKIIFSKDKLESIVRGYALFGHIHTNSVMGRIVYNGSFDRLAYREEREKGFYITTRKNDVYDIKFIENQDAAKFITLTPFGDSLDELKKDLFNKVDKVFGPYYTGHLRIVCKDVTNRSVLYKLALDKYPTLDISCKTEKEVREEAKIEQEIQTFTSISITESNIAELIYKYIKDTDRTSICTLEDVQYYLCDRE